ncbi:type 1 glutamine amidotransferase [Nodosilinea sp. LEGE 06152]|uniref:type 1 glutamine amidotransferase domain-containing protein n=1 Tax=Nodosilinea sp. LEGE 06152 TaxID=2777966 RepID=UPI0018806A1F|nr:type 1 glutamine amidotransferase domain-containing protein [Nodosilinea sp. LEGE 06152]MBE9155917.1 type 1 glutamine amidotransferase [Nodosilinea sp. LEGE 06152]
MAEQLKNRRVAILATDGFEQVELTEPKQALEAAGAQVHVIAPEGDSIQGWNHHDKGDKVTVDRTLDQVKASDYDALVLPGGVLNPDQLRTNEQAVQFVRAFFADSKPVASICHGPWTLVEADVVKGRRVTSWPSLKTDLSNAGATWVDQEVVVDQGLVTSRNPHDLPAFNSKIVEEFCEGKHLAQAQSA